MIKQPWLRVVIFCIAFLAVYMVLYWFLDSGASMLNSLADRLGRIVGSTNPDFNFLLLTVVLSFVVNLAMVYVFRKFVDRQSVHSLGFDFRNRIHDAIAGFLIPLVILGTVTLLLYFSGNLEWTDISFEGNHFVAGLFIMIIVAIGEEIVFRGYILNNLLQSVNRWLALGISALLFAMMHSNNPEVTIISVLNLFVAGILLGLNYIFTRNLYFAILLHTSWNFLQGPVLGFPVSGVQLESVLHPEVKGNEFITGGGFGLEGSLLTAMLIAVAILILVLLYMRNNALISTKPA